MATKKTSTKTASKAKPKRSKKAAAPTAVGEVDGAPAYGDEPEPDTEPFPSDDGPGREEAPEEHVDRASDDASADDGSDVSASENPDESSDEPETVSRPRTSHTDDRPWWLERMIARDGARYVLMSDGFYERLPVPLTSSELMERSKEQARCQKELAAMKERHKERKAEMASEEAKLALRITELADIVDSGEEHREVECARLGDPYRLMAIMVRKDALSIVTGRDRPLTEQERHEVRQTKMF